MADGWVLDAHLDRTTERMTLWLLLDDGRVRRLDRAWTPIIHVHAEAARLESLAVALERDEYRIPFGPYEVGFERRRLDLEDARQSVVLAIRSARPSRLARLAEAIDGSGGWGRLSLYSVDPRFTQRFLSDLGTHPFGRVRLSAGELQPLDARCDVDWRMPPLRVCSLHVECDDEHGHRTAVAPIERITIEPLPRLGSDAPAGTPIIIERAEPAVMMVALNDAIRTVDADVIMTEGGDIIDLPALHRLSAVAKVPLVLGRSDHDARPRTTARTAWSYGRLIRKEAYHALEGRIHIDVRGSFLVREGGLEGLLELARLSGLSAQDLSRLSPGSAISAMQMRQAMDDGVLVPWKKNRPEDMKTGLELLRADRGGLYLEPSVGVHRDVVEIDFASLFPSIIATRNISPETMGCSCCDPAEDADGGRCDDGRLPLDVGRAAAEVQRRRGSDESLRLQVPGLALHTCTRRHGFLGRVVAPVIRRRQILKGWRMRKGDGFDRRQNLLKWILVTCFGYTGYKNARFGRIECHEAICAWSREILLQAMEEAQREGWEALHAIVDSLWLKDREARDADQRARSMGRLVRRIEARVGVPIDIEETYDWIAFVPNRTNGSGALTKYFGIGAGGWKIRGVESRQHSTCDWVRRLQQQSLELLRESPDEEAQTAVVEHLHEQLELLSSGRVPLLDLIVARRVRREVEDTRVANLTTAALRRAASLERRIPPGHKVRFAVVGWRRRDLIDRVRLRSEIAAGCDSVRGQAGDVAHYAPLAVRAVSAVLSPFGWSDARIEAGSSRQVSMDMWT